MPPSEVTPCQGPALSRHHKPQLVRQGQVGGAEEASPQPRYETTLTHHERQETLTESPGANPGTPLRGPDFLGLRPLSAGKPGPAPGYAESRRTSKGYGCTGAPGQAQGAAPPAGTQPQGPLSQKLLVSGAHRGPSNKGSCRSQRNYGLWLLSKDESLSWEGTSSGLSQQPED